MLFEKEKKAIKLKQVCIEDMFIGVCIPNVYSIVSS